MKSLARVAVVGFTGVVLLKIGTSFIGPLLAMLLGLIFLTVKIAVAAAVLYFVYSLIKRREESDEVEVEDIVREAEIIVEDAVDTVDDAIDDVMDAVDDTLDDL